MRRRNVREVRRCQSGAILAVISLAVVAGLTVAGGTAQAARHPALSGCSSPDFDMKNNLGYIHYEDNSGDEKYFLESSGNDFCYGPGFESGTYVLEEADGGASGQCVTALPATREVYATVCGTSDANESWIYLSDNNWKNYNTGTCIAGNVVGSALYLTGCGNIPDHRWSLYAS